MTKRISIKTFIILTIIVSSYMTLTFSNYIRKIPYPIPNNNSTNSDESNHKDKKNSVETFVFAISCIIFVSFVGVAIFWK